MNSKDRSKDCNGTIIIYNGMCKSGEYFDEAMLPTINGIRIESIWCPDDFCTDPRFIDAAGWSYHTPNSFTDTKRLNGLNFLLPEWKELFGWQTVNGKHVFVRHISFRTDSSGHASWDSIMSIYCGDNSMSVWYDRKNDKTDKSCLTQDDPYVQKWINQFKKKFTLTYPKEYYWNFKPHFVKLDEHHGTFIQRVNDEWFPDVYCKPWKNYGYHAYKAYSDGRVSLLDENYGKIYRLNQVKEPYEGMSNLIYLRDWKPHYVFPSQWSKTYDDSFIRYTIEKIGNKYIHLTYHNSTDGDKKMELELCYLKYFYTIFGIMDVDMKKAFDHRKNYFGIKNKGLG